MCLVWISQWSIGVNFNEFWVKVLRISSVKIMLNLSKILESVSSKVILPIWRLTYHLMLAAAFVQFTKTGTTWWVLTETNRNGEHSRTSIRMRFVEQMSLDSRHNTCRQPIFLFAFFAYPLDNLCATQFAIFINSFRIWIGVEIHYKFE